MFWEGTHVMMALRVAFKSPSWASVILIDVHKSIFIVTAFLGLEYNVLMSIRCCSSTIQIKELRHLSLSDIAHLIPLIAIHYSPPCLWICRVDVNLYTAYQITYRA